MKKVLSLLTLSLSLSAFAGRPTPKGDSMIAFRTVMEQAQPGEFILSVENNASNHYLMRTQALGKKFCQTKGFFLEVISRDRVTAAPTYEIKSDLVKHPCELQTTDDLE